MAAKLVVAWAAWLTLGTFAFAQETGVGLAIVYDTSGSMRDKVRDGSGKSSPKYEIANRALEAVVGRLEAFERKQNSEGTNKLEAGLFVFDGKRARAAVKFGRFDATAMRTWTRNFIAPDGPTPLGEAVQVACDALRKSDAAQRHVLAITDGENTAGPDPAAVVGQLNKPAQNDRPISVHFIAFDVNANVFRRLKEQGATVVAAADEKELNNQLEFILEEKILLEK